jgi:3D (Asp-Asp-Asp) domain-containing protein
MNTNKKIHKLTMAILLCSVMSISITTYVEKRGPCTVLELKKELKQMNLKTEANAASKLVVRQDGIKFGEMFIPKNNKSEYKVITARLTVYWARGKGTDSDSSKLRSSTGYTLKQGDSIAVDPRVIPYNKEVIIPNVGLVRAVDTGTAVRDKVASGGKLPVIDIFFMNKKDAELFANTNPKIVKVAVLN